MRKKRNIGLLLAIGSIVVVLGLLGWFLSTVFESESPTITVKPLPEFLSKKQEFSLSILDMKRGLKQLQVTMKQGGRKLPSSKRNFRLKACLTRKAYTDLMQVSAWTLLR